MEPYIIITDGFDKDLFAEISSIAGIQVHPKYKLEKIDLVQNLDRANGLVIRSATQITSEIIKMAPNLKYVVRAGEGVDNIDLNACRERGIKVANTPGGNNNSAAEHALALIFTLLRQTAWAHQTMKEGKWEKSKFLGTELFEKTVGIVGMGRIGTLFAQRISGFNPQVLFYDPYCEKSKIPYAKKVDSLDTLFSSSDIITIHVPLMKETENLITEKHLSKMKPHSILVNASRGGILNEEDLYKCLQSGKLAGAALDVFENEPLPANSKLRELNNLILTPHLGAGTKEAQFRVGKMVIEQIKEFFLNNNLLDEVSF
jgi:D-3-phosphoglycerate dehydrogenase